MIWTENDVVGRLIHDVAHVLRLRIDDALRPYGLTRIGWLAIGIIQQSRMLTQSELASRLKLGTAATGKLVDRLEERGLVKRLDHPEDRRAYLLTLSPAARDLLGTIETVGDQLRNEVLQDLSESECHALQQALQKIKARLTDSRSQAA